MDKQKKLDHVFLNMAKEVSTLSYCVRAKVGSLIVKNGNVISFGYNGTPYGSDNCCEEVQYMDVDAPMWLDQAIIEKKWPFEDIKGRYALVSKSEVLHAESNAILKAASMGFSTTGATIYSTLSPCKDCAKLILQAGIVRVMYLELFKRDFGSVEFLKQFIKVEKHDLQ